MLKSLFLFVRFSFALLMLGGLAQQISISKSHGEDDVAFGIPKLPQNEEQAAQFVSLTHKGNFFGAKETLLHSEIQKQIHETYVWAWPMIYLSNVERSLRLIQSPGISGGAPVAPINRISMLTDVIDPRIQSVPCPNRDVIYGFGMMDLSHEPVVVQVPDFRDRYWLYQIGDHRTNSFAELGTLYDSKPGFYLLAGPTWNGEVPNGIRQVFRSPTNLAYILPRILVKEKDLDQESLQVPLKGISIYPLSRFNGKIKSHDWSKKKWYPQWGTSSRETCKMVSPANFISDLRRVLETVDPLDGEESRYAVAQSLVDFADSNPTWSEQIHMIADETEKQTIAPLFDFRHAGTKLPNHWTTIKNGAAFGTDYRTRTATAKSNVFVNREREAKYFYLEHSADGQLLSGEKSYQLTFPAGSLPPNTAFWSLSLYDSDHRIYSNAWNRYSVGSVNENLTWNSDGSLTILVQSQIPDVKMQNNWLPSPKGPIVLYLRVYSPAESVLNGEWLPPAAMPERILLSTPLLATQP